MLVITYSGKIKFTIDGEPKFSDTVKIRELKRRVYSDLSSDFSMTFVARYSGTVYSYIVTFHNIDGNWVGQYSVHSKDEGSTQGNLSGIEVSEKDSKLEITGTWIENSYNYWMRVSAKVEKSEEFSPE